MQELQQERQRVAAARVQAVQRGRLVRMEGAQRYLAASRVQAVQRGRTARRLGRPQSLSPDEALHFLQRFCRRRHRRRRGLSKRPLPQFVPLAAPPAPELRSEYVERIERAAAVLQGWARRCRPTEAMRAAEGERESLLRARLCAESQAAREQAAIVAVLDDPTRSARLRLYLDPTQAERRAPASRLRPAQPRPKSHTGRSSELGTVPPWAAARGGADRFAWQAARELSALLALDPARLHVTCDATAHPAELLVEILPSRTLGEIPPDVFPFQPVSFGGIPPEPIPGNGIPRDGIHHLSDDILPACSPLSPSRSGLDPPQAAELLAQLLRLRSPLFSCPALRHVHSEHGASAGTKPEAAAYQYLCGIPLPHLSAASLCRIPLPHTSAAYLCRIPLPHTSAAHTYP